MTKFTDYFLEKDKQLALQYRKHIDEYYDLSSQLLNVGEFNKSEMYFKHAITLISELRRLNREKLTYDAAAGTLELIKQREETGQAVLMKRDRF
ncbi:hypothetical protein J416_09359 [Gracilibacillus halophilus YIM-C55.5]|uniref:Response regulator aspartate phosphatase n=1 Tax=Gracilibacillus halophilus YIM-C55.5 TaxID=1308866 RepID=N4WBQ8_9BACI|nr:hypothetical protein [Gracilibacillus halophilus]ENH96694.1 hypothetical protein J416_09359 [Gracilibacillus halophilus YIM-C55.5]